MKLLIFALLAVTQCFGAYGWYILHTPAGSKVSSGPHTDFPVLIDITDNALRVTGSGGNVTDAQGDDIQPASDATCTTFLKFERIAYDGTTGRVRMHVKVPSLSSSSNVYLCFGDGSVTTDQSDPTNVWNSGFVAVFHFGDGSTLSLSDSTSNGLTLTNNNTVNATSDGQIYGAAGTNWANSPMRYLSRADVNTLDLVSSYTITAWVKPSSCATGYPTIVVKGDSTNRNYAMDIENSTCKLRVISTQGASTYRIGLSSSAVSTSAFSHVAGRYNGSNLQTFINGAADGSAVSMTGNADNSTEPLTVGMLLHSGTGFDAFNGPIDELRIHGTARSDGWIATEYNSGIPSSFWTTGSATAVGGFRPSRIFVQ